MPFCLLTQSLFVAPSLLAAAEAWRVRTRHVNLKSGHAAGQQRAGEGARTLPVG